MRKGQPEGEQPTPTEYSYDRIPYKSFPFSDTHPSRIATIGHLFGLNPPNPETAKVLELGSSSGGNIIPMALAYPNAHFYGIDLSKVEIEMAKRLWTNSVSRMSRSNSSTFLIWMRALARSIT